MSKQVMQSRTVQRRSRRRRSLAGLSLMHEYLFLDPLGSRTFETNFVMTFGTTLQCFYTIAHLNSGISTPLHYFKFDIALHFLRIISKLDLFISGGMNGLKLDSRLPIKASHLWGDRIIVSNAYAGNVRICVVPHFMFSSWVEQVLRGDANCFLIHWPRHRDAER